MRPIMVSTLAVFMLFLSGCLGITQPSDSDIKQMSTQHFNQQFAGLFTVTEAVKDNGYKQNDTHYVAEMTIKATADQSLDDYAKQLVQDANLSAFEKMTQSMTIGLLKMTLPDFSQGDELEFRRNYLFINTDKGWLLKKELNDENTNSL